MATVTKISAAALKHSAEFGSLEAGAASAALRNFQMRRAADKNLFEEIMTTIETSGLEEIDAIWKSEITYLLKDLKEV